MQDLVPENEQETGRSFTDVLSGMAQDGAKQASDGFAAMLRDKPIGASDSPEADRVQTRSLKETLEQIARDGLDPLMGRGFERETHAMAADQYSEERRRSPAREHDPQGRDFG